MLKVYCVVADVNKYQYFQTDDTKFQEKTMPLIHYGQRLGKKWKPPELYIYRPRHEEGTFVGFCGNHVFALPSDSRNVIESFVQQSCEPLDFQYKDRNFTLLNCVNCIEALDVKRTIGDLSWPEKHVFIPTRFHFTLFCIPQNNYLYCVEGLEDKDDEFKGTVERLGLKGLCFQEVWSEKPKPPTKPKRK